MDDSSPVAEDFKPEDVREREREGGKEGRDISTFYIH